VKIGQVVKVKAAVYRLCGGRRKVETVVGKKL